MRKRRVTSRFTIGETGKNIMLLSEKETGGVCLEKDRMSSVLDALNLA